MYLNLTIWNDLCREFDCFKRPLLAVSYAYTSICTVNNFKGVYKYIV